MTDKAQLPGIIPRDNAMKICKIWDADYPWDIRVEKVATALAAAGHSVHLVCRNQARRPGREWNGSFTIHRLPVFSSEIGPLHTLWNFPYPLNPAWIMTVHRVLRETRTELILVRDILLALPAAFLGRIYRIPVVLDMAENYPAMLQDRLQYTPTGLLGRLIRHPTLMAQIESWVIRLVDHIIVVVEESRERLLEAGVPSARLTIVSNTPRIEQNAPLSSSPAEGIALVYLGNLDGSRGVDIAIQAIRHLKDIGHLARLSVIGDGPNIHQLRMLVSQLDVADRVRIMGRLPFSQVQEIMAQSHVGIIPHYATEAWNTTIPNKLFDYMLWGLPVIVSDTRPAARIVRTEGCGEVFRDRDAVDLARCIMTLEDPAVRKIQSAKGREAIYKRYNWSHDAQVLVQTIEAVRASYNRF